MAIGRWRVLDVCASFVGYVFTSMTALRLRTRMRTMRLSSSKSNSLLSTNLGSAIEARLHTAVSSLSEYCTISQHRFEDCGRSHDQMGTVFGMLASLLSGGSVNDALAANEIVVAGKLPTLDEGDEGDEEQDAHQRVVYIPPSMLVVDGNGSVQL
jgi:hypothetical protein